MMKATDINMLLVFTSDLGSTRTMAQAVAKGVESVPGTILRTIDLVTGDEGSAEDVRWAHGIILGSPVKHRSMHHRMKKFIERLFEQLWLTDEMVSKVGGVFTVGGGHGDVGAGCELTMLGMLASLAAGGVILVPFPKCTPGADTAGLHWGPNGRTGGKKMAPHSLNEEMIMAGFHHGANVSRVAAAQSGRDLFARGNVAPTPDILALFQGGKTM
jgi:NAD(P)H dehydrogenase (quinone)